MCTDGKIWDWTVQECRQCGNLRDLRLCSRGDVEKYNLEASKVTGNWPLLMFEGCQGSGAALLTDIGVGRCSTCEKRDTCGAMYEYPSKCIDATNVKCEMCLRVRESVYFSLLKDSIWSATCFDSIWSGHILIVFGLLTLTVRVLIVCTLLTLTVRV